MDATVQVLRGGLAGAEAGRMRAADTQNATSKTPAAHAGTFVYEVWASFALARCVAGLTFGPPNYANQAI